MKFKKPCNDIIEKYSEESIRYDGAEVVGQLLDQIDSHIDEQKEKIAQINYMMLNGKTDHIDSLVRDFYKIVNKVRNKTVKIAQLSGAVDVAAMRQENCADVKFIENEDHIKIVFPDLLPKRINYADKANLLSYADLKQMYVPVFQSYYKNRAYKVWDRRVIIRYMHIYESEKKMRDFDNFETKIITDLITPLVNYDDSPKECMIMSEYRIGKKNHTEVDIIPFDSKIDKILENAFDNT